MAKINLKKTVISHQEAQSQYNNTFNQLIISAEKIDDEKLKKIYESLFYKIPKEGKLSHTTIVTKSNDIIHPEVNKNFDNDINELEIQVNEKNEELLKLDLPPTEHFLFANNTFIKEGDPILGLIMGDQVWFVQEGYKRKVNDENLIEILRKINNDDPRRNQYGNAPNLIIPLSDSYLLQIATATNINKIPEAQDINDGSDLSISPLIAKENQEYVFSQLKVEFECFGVEKYHKFTTDEEGEGFSEYYGSTDGFFYLDKDASCELQYQTDLDPSESFLPQINNITFKTYLTRPISRDLSLYSGNPLDPSFYETPINTEIEVRPPDIFNTYYPPVEVWKQWGQGNKFPSVINVGKGSRIKVRIINPDGLYTNPDTNSPWQHLSGINTNISNQTLFNFNKNSSYGTRMINNFCPPNTEDCYGRLNQNPFIKIPDTFSNLKNKNERLLKIFSNPNSRYYKKEKSTGDRFGKEIIGKVYGQPILYLNSFDGGNFVVYIGGYKGYLGNTDWAIFFDIEEGGFHRLKNKDLHGQYGIDGYRVYDDSPLFRWTQPLNDSNDFQDGALNNPKLYYPGLKGEHINYTYTDLDNNPNFGNVAGFLSNIGNTIFGGVIEDYGVDPAIENIGLPGINNAEDFPGYSISGTQLNDNPFNGNNFGSNSEIVLNNSLDYFNIHEELNNNS